MRASDDKSSLKKRILFVSYTFQPEPGPIQGLPLAKWLVQQGYSVKVLTGFPQYPLGKIYDGYKIRPFFREFMDGVEVMRVPIYPSHDRAALKRILTYVSFMVCGLVFGAPRVGKTDLVYYFDSVPTTGFLVRTIARFRGAKSVQHVGDLWPDTVTESGMLPKPVRRPVEGFLGWLIKRFYRGHAQISVSTPGFGKAILARGTPPEKVRLIYNWADESLFRPLPKDPELARELGFEGKTTVLYGGAMGPMQQLEVAIEAAAMLRDVPDFQLVLVGTGPHEDLVKRRAQELGATNVRFLGHVPISKMPAINAAADILLVHLRDVPLLHMTIPSKTQVMLACGKPGVVGLRGDGGALIEESGGGLVVEPSNPQAMADAFRTLLAMSPEEREAMGRRGYEFYRSKIAFEVGAKTTEAMFREALGES